MKTAPLQWCAALLLLANLSATAAVHYVSVNSLNPTPPYTNWDMAATTIQDAVDAATDGDEIVVTNGVYATGGRAVYGIMTNRVAVDKPLSLRSVNGPEFTIIEGYQVPDIVNSNGAIRCVYLTNGAVLSGFTITHGATLNLNQGDWEATLTGGGVRCASREAIVSNCFLFANAAFYAGGGGYSGTFISCTITSNWAGFEGGGVYGATVQNSTLNANGAESGGGASWSTLNNCTLTANGAQDGGGADSSTLTDCILENNGAHFGGGAEHGTLNNCIITNNSASSDGGGVYASTVNNCILIGNFGYRAGGACASTLNFCIVSANQGYMQGGGSSFSSLNNCAIMGNSGGFNGGGAFYSSLDNCLLTENSASEGGGAFQANLNNCTLSGNTAESEGGGVAYGTLNNCIVYHNTAPISSNFFAATLNYSCTVPPPTLGVGNIIFDPLFVDWPQGNLHLQPNSPCINAGNNGYVTNSSDLADNPRIVGGTVDMGAYEFQGAVHYVDPTSATPTVPYTTWATAANTIQDAVDAARDGDEIIVTNGVYTTGGRAVYGTMTNRVVIDKAITVHSLFGPAVTVIRGAPGFGGGNGDGAIRCVYVGANAVLSGFTLTNGHTRTTADPDSEGTGGAAWCEGSGVITNCTLSGNSAGHSGGGVYSGILNNCTLKDNSVWASGGGAYNGTLNNCTLTGNTAGWGGGACGSTLNNCTVVGNSADRVGGGFGGGVYAAMVNNCIVYYNAALYYPNHCNGYLAYSCTTPLPSGIGNIDNAPLFVDTEGWTNLRLQSNSPCINAGNNAYAAGSTDLDGNPRVAGARVDMGAYEFQGTTLSGFAAWLWQYGLRIDGSVDSIDSDGDGLNNWQEWRCGTNPTNASSALRLLLPQASGSNVLIRWESVAGINYFLERSTNLFSTPMFQPIATNLPGLSDTTSYTDSNSPPQATIFYRVGVGN